MIPGIGSVSTYSISTFPGEGFIVKLDSDTLILAFAEADDKIRTFLAQADTDTLILALLEQHQKFYRDLNSPRFLRIKKDQTTLEIKADTTTVKVKHDAGGSG